VALNRKQTEILQEIRACVARRGYPPTVRELCAAVNLRSPGTVHAHLTELERQGFITRAAGKTRAIVLCDAQVPEAGIPILGDVAAGAPITALEDIRGRLPYTPENDGEYFALIIRGDSMKNAGILSGDKVVVRRGSSARSGQIVVALLDDEATCKRLCRKNGTVLLLPENDAYNPIPGETARILGVVTAVVRTYE